MSKKKYFKYQVPSATELKVHNGPKLIFVMFSLSTVTYRNCEYFDQDSTYDTATFSYTRNRILYTVQCTVQYTIPVLYNETLFLAMTHPGLCKII